MANIITRECDDILDSLNQIRKQIPDVKFRVGSVPKQGCTCALIISIPDDSDPSLLSREFTVVKDGKPPVETVTTLSKLGVTLERDRQYSKGNILLRQLYPGS